jgi:CO dehydrogenase nickel-insertion accessory protein CooC1
LKESARAIGLDIFGFVPHDEQIAAFDLVGKPITSLPADSRGQAAVRQLVDTCILG